MQSSKSFTKTSQSKRYDSENESQRDSRRLPDAKRVSREREQQRRNKRDWE